MVSYHDGVFDDGTDRCFNDSSFNDERSYNESFWNEYTREHHKCTRARELAAGDMCSFVCACIGLKEYV